MNKKESSMKFLTWTVNHSRAEVCAMLMVDGVAFEFDTCTGLTVSAPRCYVRRIEKLVRHNPADGPVFSL